MKISVIISVLAWITMNGVSAGAKKEMIVNAHAKIKCSECHITTHNEIDGIKKNEFQYGGDIVVLCNKCHMRINSHMHAVNISPTEDMKVPAFLPLDADGKINCNTCHNACANFPHKDKLRRFGKDGVNENAIELCFSCHSKEYFRNANPHLDLEAKQKCMMFCHYNVEILLNGYKTKLRRCIRCHSHRAHPASFSHVVKPSMSVPRGFPLDTTGEITCITCHDPHFEIQRSKNKGIRNGFKCNLCHEDNMK